MKYGRRGVLVIVSHNCSILMFIALKVVDRLFRYVENCLLLMERVVVSGLLLCYVISEMLKESKIQVCN